MKKSQTLLRRIGLALNCSMVENPHTSDVSRVEAVKSASRLKTAKLSSAPVIVG